MRNKNVGMLVIGIAVVILVIVLIFNSGLKKIVDGSCDMGSSCPMYDTIAIQTNISLAIAGLVLVIGLFLLFSKEHEKVVVREIKEIKEVERREDKKDKEKKIDMKGLDKDEKKVIEILLRENGGIFQKTLMEELEVGKVKITRLLDKLEAKQLVERKRRGMNNFVVLRRD